MSRPKVDIIICTYNNSDIIGRCLSSIAKLTYEINKCFVVDDCSSDNTIQNIKTEFSWVEIIEKTVQSGPSDSRNIGLNSSESEYILFLDSDVVVTKKFLMFLVKSIQRNGNIAICGGKLLLPNKTIDSAGGGLTRLGIGFDIGHKKDRNNYNQGKDVFYIPSAAMLVKRKLNKELGGFDETYFYGHEDTDLCWRVNIAGFRVYYEPKAIAYHYKNQTIKNMMSSVYYYGTRNRIRSLIKNHQLSTLILYLPLYFIFSFFDVIIRSYRKEKIAAWWWNLRHIKETLKERKSIQSLRVFNDKQLSFSSLYTAIK